VPGGRRGEDLAPGVPGEAALVVTVPLAGEALVGVALPGLGEHLGKRPARTAGELVGRVDALDSSEAAGEVGVGGAERHHPGQRRVQPGAAAREGDEQGALEPGPGRQRMSVACDAIVGGDEVDERDDAPPSAFVRDSSGDIELGVAGAGGQAGCLRGLGGVPAERTVALDLRREQRVPERGGRLVCATRVRLEPEAVLRLERQPPELLVEQARQLDVRGEQARPATVDHDRCDAGRDVDVVVPAGRDPGERPRAAEGHRLALCLLEPDPHRGELGLDLGGPIHGPPPTRSPTPRSPARCG
jgi:hypothetical protein